MILTAKCYAVEEFGDLVMPAIASGDLRNVTPGTVVKTPSQKFVRYFKEGEKVFRCACWEPKTGTPHVHVREVSASKVVA